MQGNAVRSAWLRAFALLASLPVCARGDELAPPEYPSGDPPPIFAAPAAIGLVQLWQQGSGNDAHIVQADGTSHAFVQQSGNGNAADILQQGEDHRASIVQEGDRNRFSLTQFGQGQSLDVVQWGDDLSAQAVQR